MKITVVGAGNVGATAEKKLVDISAKSVKENIDFLKTLNLW